MPKKHLSNERGSVLVLTLLVLVALTGLAMLYMSAIQMKGLIRTQRMEDNAALIVAAAGAEEAKLWIRNLDDRLDTNDDGQIDSKDEPYRQWQVPIEGGVYDYEVQGVFANEQTLHFRIVGAPWNDLLITILEDGVEAASQAITSTTGGPDTISLSTSIDPDVHTYQVVALLSRESPGALNIWMRINTPFAGNSTAGGTLIQTFNSASGGLQSQTATINIQSNLIAANLDTVPTDGFAGDTYTIRSSGLVNGQRHNIQTTVNRDSLLKYARFCQAGVTYGRGAVVSGYFYGQTLTVTAPPPTPTPWGPVLPPANFQKPVQVTNSTISPGPTPSAVTMANSTFRYTPQLSSRPIQLPTDADLNEQRTLSQENGVHCSSNMTINLSSFNFAGASPTYGGSSTLCGDALTSNFNGLIFSEGNISVSGTLSGKSLTLVAGGANRTMTITGNIYTRTTLDPNNPKPVNLGLVATGPINIADNTPRVLHINAALFSLNSNWQALGGGNGTTIIGTDRDNNGTIGGRRCSPPYSAQTNGNCNSSGQIERGTYDINGNGILESGLNNMNWQEIGTNTGTGATVTAWALVIRGPIITATGGAAGNWSGAATPVQTPTDFPEMTRNYMYDTDIMRYPPPHFPVALSSVQTMEFSETAWDEAIVDPNDPNAP